MSRSTRECVSTAFEHGIVVPAFNIPYLPMMESVVQALHDTDTFGLIQVARLEWRKFRSGSLEAVRDEYDKTKDENCTRLHLDHIPVIDEDNLHVDYRTLIKEAIDLGYESVMVDGSRLPLEENIAVATEVGKMAHAAGIPFEAELGAVLGHETGPLPPYDELFESGRGFTDIEEARRFVSASAVDWLSVAIGNIHGAISDVARSKKKIAARLNIEHLEAIRKATGTPLVLHGGSGIEKNTLHQAFKHGIAKINIATTIRQAYEESCGESVAAGQRAVYNSVVELVRDELEIEGSAAIIRGDKMLASDSA